MFAFQEGGNLTCRHRFTYSLVMELTQHLEAVRAAQYEVLLREASYQDGITARDVAIVAARNAGVSVIDIADACGISRQQVHKIVACSASDTVKQLREEVMDSGPYENMLEDDQAHVDYFVKQLAAQRGIKLEER